MGEAEKKKSKSLKFKGEKNDLGQQKRKEKNKKRKAEQMEAAESMGDVGGFGKEEEVDGWIPTPSTSSLVGPIHLTLPPSSLPTHLSSPPPTGVCLAVHPTLSIPIIQPLPTPTTADTSVPLITPTDLNSLELPSDATLSLTHTSTLTSSSPTTNNFVAPTNVHQVFVCTRILDSSDKVTLRNSLNKFLACSEIGEISSNSEARGVQEEWTLIPLGSDDSGKIGYLGFKSHYGKFLTVDETLDGRLEVRGDGDEISAWRVWMQSDKLPSNNKSNQDSIKKKKQSKKVGLEGLEEEEIRNFHTRGSGRFVGSKESLRDLKIAKKEGHLRETMLDRRMKVKHDRYC